jgi:hypothetical protein
MRALGCEYFQWHALNAVRFTRSNKINRKNMKKLFVSAGLVAIGATVLESAKADDTSSTASTSTSSSSFGNPTSPNYWSVGASLRGRPFRSMSR